MLAKKWFVTILALGLVAACGEQEQAEPSAVADKAAVPGASGGLIAKTLRNGYGREAQAGDFVTVHYTGWLYDETAENNRGKKFDSSVDRGQKFQFILGAGRVIKGWDQGVVGMVIGEKRELTIPSDLAYGERGSGAAIPSGATLVFEVELFAAEPPPDGAG